MLRRLQRFSLHTLESNAPARPRNRRAGALGDRRQLREHESLPPKTHGIVRCPLSLGLQSPAIRIYLEVTRAPAPIFAFPPHFAERKLGLAVLTSALVPSLQEPPRGKKGGAPRAELPTGDSPPGDSPPGDSPPGDSPPGSPRLTRPAPSPAAGEGEAGAPSLPPPPPPPHLAQFPRPRYRGCPRRGSPGARAARPGGPHLRAEGLRRGAGRRPPLAQGAGSSRRPPYRAVPYGSARGGARRAARPVPSPRRRLLHLLPLRQ